MNHKVKLFNDAIRVLSSAIDYDGETMLHHARRVGLLSYRIAKSLNLAEPGTMFHAGLLHDIGGIGLPEHVVHSAMADFADPESRKHPELGAAILRPLRFFRHLEPIIRDHHEQYDGRGFPVGKKERQVPLGASIVLIADVLEVNLRTIEPEDRSRIAPLLARRMGGRQVPPWVAERTAWLLSHEPDLVDVLFDPSRLERMVASINEPPPLELERVQDSDLLMQLIGTLVRIIDAKYGYMAGHSIRVAYYAYQMARQFSEQELNRWDMLVSGLLHDLGIVGVPREILDIHPDSDRGPGEQRIFAKHAEITAELLSQVEMLAHLAFPASCHHERYDGSGYPYHLNAERIPLVARVLAYADRYDSICSEIPDESVQRRHLHAMNEMKRMRGLALDPNLWDVAASVFEQYGVASHLHEQRVQSFADNIFADSPVLDELFADEPPTIRRLRPGQKGMVLFGVEQWCTLFVDRDWQIVRGAERLSKLVGHVKPRCFLDLLSKQDALLLSKEAADLREIDSFCEVFVLRDSLPIEVLVAPHPGGYLVHVRSAERQVQTLKHVSLMHKNFVGSLEAVLIVDEQGVIIDANQSLVSMFGYSLEELLGQSPEMLGLEDLPSAPSSRLTDPLSVTQEHVRLTEFKTRSKQGEELWIMASTSAVYDARGNQVGSLIHIIDVTLRKQQEIELEKRDALLKKRNEELESLYQLESQLSAIASHDIRSPLSSMITGATLLRDMGDAMPAEKRKAMLDKLIEAGHHTLRLLQSTLELRKLETGKKSIEKSTHNLATVVQVAAQRCQVTAARGIEIAVRATRREIEVEIDPTKIDQAVSNLICNAVKFSPDEGRIEVVVDVMGDDYAVVSVADQGPGIPEQDLEAIFDKYYQVKHDGKTAARGHGVGLGLSIVRKLVALHGGRVWAENRPEGGALFVIQLPRHQIGVARGAGVRDTEADASTPWVWLVQDGADSDDVIEETLTERGMRIERLQPGDLQGGRQLPQPEAVFDLSSRLASAIRERLRRSGLEDRPIIAVSDTSLDENRSRQYETVLLRPILDVEVANLLDLARMKRLRSGKVA